MEANEMNEYVSEVKRGKGVGFERIRRISGYLVGGMDKWNNAKRHEEKDRISHTNNLDNSMEATAV